MEKNLNMCLKEPVFCMLIKYAAIHLLFPVKTLHSGNMPCVC